MEAHTIHCSPSNKDVVYPKVVLPYLAMNCTFYIRSRYLKASLKNAYELSSSKHKHFIVFVFPNENRYS